MGAATSGASPQWAENGELAVSGGARRGDVSTSEDTLAGAESVRLGATGRSKDVGLGDSSHALVLGGRIAGANGGNWGLLSIWRCGNEELLASGATASAGRTSASGALFTGHDEKKLTTAEEDYSFFFPNYKSRHCSFFSDTYHTCVYWHASFIDLSYMCNMEMIDYMLHAAIQEGLPADNETYGAHNHDCNTGGAHSTLMRRGIVDVGRAGGVIDKKGASNNESRHGEKAQ